MSSLEKFTERLPSKSKFYSSLSGKEISDKKYQYALNVWNKFEMKTIRLSRFIFKMWCFIINWLLLTDVFEKFINRCLKNYNLCSSHYLTEPVGIECLVWQKSS